MKNTKNKNNKFTPAQIKLLKKKFREIANGEIEIDGKKLKKKNRTQCSCSDRKISKDIFAEFYNNLFSVTSKKREKNASNL